MVQSDVAVGQFGQIVPGDSPRTYFSQAGTYYAGFRYHKHLENALWYTLPDGSTTLPGTK